MVQTVRIIVDPPASGEWNMSVDRALLETAADEGAATLRLYRWTPATLSLGYFQTYAGRESHAASRNCPVVRRATGGGAIVHDRELTYSLALPAGSGWARDHTGLVRAVHRSLVNCLAELGVRGCALWENQRQGAGQDADVLAAEPFLCFLRRVDVDIVLGPGKIVGSAQRRWRDAILQHGSILLDQSPAAPELPGIAQLAGAQVAEELVERWPAILAAQMGWRLEPSAVAETELRRARTIQGEWFGNDAWTRKR